MDRQLIGAYHRSEREVSDDALDRALGLSPQRWEHRHERDARLAHRHPGESIVNVATPFEMCRHIFHALKLDESERFADLGCAAGRVVLYGAAVSPAQFVGIELIEERAAEAGLAAATFDNVEIIHGDVLDQDFGGPTVFYAHRPFSVETEAEVLSRLHDEARRRPITVVSLRLQPSSFDAATFKRDDYGALSILRSARCSSS